MLSLMKYILCTLGLLINFESSFGMDQQIEKEHKVGSNISHTAHVTIHENVLREVALKSISQHNVFDSIKDKLRKFHSDDAKLVWSQHNKDTLPKAEQQEFALIRTGNLSAVVRKDILSLVGKVENTFYTANQINSIEAEAMEAVLKGTIQINPRNDTQILIVYNLNKNFGELCIKNEKPPFNAQCQNKQSIVIVIDAADYITDIVKNGNEAWKTKNLLSKINNIYCL